MELRDESVKVDWPPQVRVTASTNRFLFVGGTSVDKAHYDPLDPDGFLATTFGM